MKKDKVLNDIKSLVDEIDETDFNIWYENLDTDMVEEGFDIVKTNLIDACMAMIEKLNELNLLRL